MKIVANRKGAACQQYRQSSQSFVTFLLSADNDMNGSEGVPISFAWQFTGMKLSPGPNRTVWIHAIRTVSDDCIATAIVARMAPQYPALLIPCGEPAGVENRSTV